MAELALVARPSKSNKWVAQCLTMEPRTLVGIPGLLVDSHRKVTKKPHFGTIFTFAILLGRSVYAQFPLTLCHKT